MQQLETLYCRAPALSRGWFRQLKNLEICCRAPFHPLATPLVLSCLAPRLSSPTSAIQQELNPTTSFPAPLPGFPSSGDVLRHLYSHLAQSSPLWWLGTLKSCYLSMSVKTSYSQTLILMMSVVFAWHRIHRARFVFFSFLPEALQNLHTNAPSQWAHLWDGDKYWTSRYGNKP